LWLSFFSFGNYKSGLEAGDFNENLANGVADLVVCVIFVDVFFFEGGHETADLSDQVESLALHVFHNL